MNGTWRAFALLAPLACAVCGGESEAPQPAPPRPEARAPATAPAPTPEPPSAAGDPVALAEAGDASRGQPLYQQYCSSCHGPEGCGGGPLSANLDPKPALHCDGDYMNALSDEHLFTVVQKGGFAVGKSPLMAPWGGTLDDAQIWDVVAYMRSLADPPYPTGGD